MRAAGFERRSIFYWLLATDYCLLMTLSDIEQILTRLSTDEALRARFVENPFALGRELGLTPTGARKLKRAAAERFDSFDATPRERRFVQVFKLLPLTHRVLR